MENFYLLMFKQKQYLNVSLESQNTENKCSLKQNPTTGSDYIVFKLCHLYVTLTSGNALRGFIRGAFTDAITTVPALPPGRQSHTNVSRYPLLGGLHASEATCLWGVVD